MDLYPSQLTIFVLSDSQVPASEADEKPSVDLRLGVGITRFGSALSDKFPGVILVERDASLKRFFEERPIFPFGGDGNIC